MVNRTEAMERRQHGQQDGGYGTEATWSTGLRLWNGGDMVNRTEAMERRQHGQQAEAMERGQHGQQD